MSARATTTSTAGPSCARTADSRRATSEAASPPSTSARPSRTAARRRRLIGYPSGPGRPGSHGRPPPPAHPRTGVTAVPRTAQRPRALPDPAVRAGARLARVDVGARELEHDARAGADRRRQQPAAVAPDDARGDREPVPAAAGVQAVGRKRRDRSRQARALVAHLDADVRACGVRTHPDRAGAVLQRVEDEVADGLRQPQPVGVHEQPRAGRVEQQLAAQRARQRPPALDRLGEQRAHLQRLRQLGRAAAARRGVEVGQREPRAAQLQLHRRHPASARGVRDDAVQAEQRRAQRRPQLVRGLRDQRHPAIRRRAQERDAWRARTARRSSRARQSDAAVTPSPPSRAPSPQPPPRPPGRPPAGIRRPTRSRRSGRRARRASAAAGTRGCPRCASRPSP